MFNKHKAGLEGVDKDRINKVIEESSRGTPFWENQQRKNARHQKQTESVLEKLSSASEQDWDRARSKADEFLRQLKPIMERIIVHIDMDAFYASVEELEDPGLAKKPMAVGSLSMISTSNYVARRFGVRAGLPGFIALKLCPQLVLVPPNIEKYTVASEKVMKVLSRYDSNLVQFGLDEAALDITQLCETSDETPEQIVSKIRSEVKDETHLTCSAGIGPNRMVAKIFADVNKPDGQFRLNTTESIESYFQNMSVRKIFGIGHFQEKVLSALNVVKCSDFIEHRAKLFIVFSESTAKFYLAAAKGIFYDTLDESEASLPSRRSKSAETTFRDSGDVVFLVEVFQQLAEKLSEDLILGSLKGKLITVKFKTSSFDVFSRSVALELATNAQSTIFNHSTRILKNVLSRNPGMTFRLLGVKMSKFQETDSKQATLSQHFQPTSPKENETDFTESENLSKELASDVIDCPSPSSSGSVPSLDENCNDFEIPEGPLSSTVTGSVCSAKSCPKVEITEDLIEETYCPVCAVIMTNISTTKLNRHINQCIDREQQREKLTKSTSGDLKVTPKLNRTKAIKKRSQSGGSNILRKRDTQSIAKFFGK